MALPKRRHSKSRRNKRRTHWKLSVINISRCSNCDQPKLPHHVCLNCGYYNNRLIFLPKES